MPATIHRDFTARCATRQHRDDALTEVLDHAEELVDVLATLEALAGRYPDDEAGRAAWAAEVHALLKGPVAA